MSIQVKVDEDLSDEVAAVFAAAGYQADTVRSQGWRGLLDEELWGRVQAEGRWLITADKEFGDVRKYGPGKYPSVILIRADNESRRQYLELAETVVRSLRLEEIPGCLVVVTPRGIRLRD
jgi:predicted nuclease of predicted toxin-antitoxin system